jgi:ankyrin repeat protein
MRVYHRAFVGSWLVLVALAASAALFEARADPLREALAAQLVFNTLHLSSAAGTPSADEIAEYRQRGQMRHGEGFRGLAVAQEEGRQLVWSLQIAFLADDAAIEAHDQMPDQVLAPYAQGIDRLTGAAQFVIPEGGFGKQRIWFVLRQDRTALNMTIDRSEADADAALAASLPRWRFFVAEARRLGLVAGGPLVADPTIDPAAATTDLFLAARTGDIPALRRALAAGAMIDAVSEEGATALAWAVANGHPEAVRVLLDAGADWRLQSPRGQSPLNVAVYLDDVPVIRLLLEHGADVDERITGPDVPDNLAGATPLYLAALHGRQAALAVLLAEGAAVDASNRQGQTALIPAAIRSDVPIVRALLAAGAADDRRDMHGLSPLIAATGSWSSNAAVVETILLLIEHGADPNLATSPLMPPPYAGMTPLAAAADAGQVAAAAALLLAGADPLRAGPTGQRPLDLALQSDNQPLQNLFSDPEEWLPRYLFHDLREAAAAGHRALVDLLIRNGLDLDRHDGDGLTLLQRAVADGNAAFVARLLEAGVDVNARDDEDGGTALMAAAFGGDLAIVAQLLEAQADPNLQASGGRSDKFAGWTALLFAADIGDARIVQLLLDAGANPWLFSADGRTAVDLARQAGEQAAIDLLENALRP